MATEWMKQVWRLGRTPLALSLTLSLGSMMGAGCGDDDGKGDEDGDNGGSTGGETNGDSTGGETNGDSTGGETNGDSTGGETNGDSTGGENGNNGSNNGEPLAAIEPSFSGKVALSETLSDRLQAVVFDGNDHVYAAGYLTTVTGEEPDQVTDQKMVVARFDLSGELDDSFGTDGVAEVNANVAAIGADDTVEGARGIALQSDGRIILTGYVPRPSVDDVEQRAIVVARLNDNGTLDDSYGTAGISLLDLGDVEDSSANEDAYHVAVDGDDRAVVFARGKADGRQDADRYVLRLTTEGELDPEFATDGMFSVDGTGETDDETGLALNDNVRAGVILSDGKILSAGYTNVNGNNHIVLIRLNADGTADDSFGEDGVAVSNAFGPEGMAEAYGVAVDAEGNYITTGYGKLDVADSAESVSLVMCAFEASGDAAGALLASWGTDGARLIDELAEREQGRNIVGLADGRLLVVGNGTTASASSDGLVAVLNADGSLDDSFNADASGDPPAGMQTFDFGGTEQFFGLALSPDGKHAVAVGHSTAEDAADAAMVVLSIGD